jgi:hypothetical protein
MQFLSRIAIIIFIIAKKPELVKDVAGFFRNVIKDYQRRRRIREDGVRQY